LKICCKHYDEPVKKNCRPPVFGNMAKWLLVAFENSFVTMLAAFGKISKVSKCSPGSRFEVHLEISQEI
jgi:hypothetical protein